MNPRRLARRLGVVVTALALAGAALWLGARAVVMSGTKSTFSYVGPAAPSPGKATARP